MACRCGIFGYYTFNVRRSVKAVLDTLFNGLRRLEYRGYDSAGLALDLADPLLRECAANGGNLNGPALLANGALEGAVKRAQAPQLPFVVRQV